MGSRRWGPAAGSGNIGRRATIPRGYRHPRPNVSTVILVFASAEDVDQIAVTIAATHRRDLRVTGDPTSSRRLALVVASILLVWIAVTLPLALGERTLYFRDVFHSHLPWKAFGAAELRSGSIPAFNPTWAMGQVFRGNPNTVSLYPGNVLYLLLPFWPAFNLHYALHWLLAAIAMFALARGLGLSPAAAVLAGLCYGGSGYLLAALTFYNLLTVVAWWPLAILGAVARRRARHRARRARLRHGASRRRAGDRAARRGADGGDRDRTAGRSPRTGLDRRGGALGALVALPQLVATWRVVGFSFRGSHGVLASQASFYSFDPRRLLELVVPFPFGHPGHFGPERNRSLGRARSPAVLLLDLPRHRRARDRRAGVAVEPSPGRRSPRSGSRWRGCSGSRASSWSASAVDCSAHPRSCCCGRRWSCRCSRDAGSTARGRGSLGARCRRSLPRRCWRERQRSPSVSSAPTRPGFSARPHPMPRSPARSARSGSRVSRSRRCCSPRPRSRCGGRASTRWSRSSWRRCSSSRRCG